MAIIPCPNKIGCESDYPLTNYSSEDPDPRTFLGYSTGTAPTSSFPRNVGGGGPRDGGPDRDDTGDGYGDTIGAGTGGAPPPLGSTWDNPVITTFAESTESQAQAHDDAGNDNVSNMTVSSDSGGDAGGITLSNGLRPAVYGNDPQQCSTPCADGTMFTVTVPANKFRALSKAKANAAALSSACKLVSLDKLCLSSINGNACVASEFSQSIIASTFNFPVTFFITSGSLPDWVNAAVDVDRVNLTGTPEVGDVGSSDFTITALDTEGIAVSKNYNITVTPCDCTISTTELTKFDQGQPYNFQLVSNAIEPQTWNLLSGTLPAGLTLSSGGIISGTPDLTNGNLDQTFTVLCTGDDGGSCSKTLTLEVLDYSQFPPGKKWRIKSYSTIDMFAPLIGGCICTGPIVPSPDWNGQFDSLAFQGFNSLQIATTGAVEIPTGGNDLGANPRLLSSDGYGTEWRIAITCTAPLTTFLWYGVKAGSNQGAKLDSPAGVYNLTSGLPFQPTVCGQAASVEIEEY